MSFRCHHHRHRWRIRHHHHHHRKKPCLKRLLIVSHQVPAGFTLRRAYLSAGAISFAAGAYLIAWVTFLLKPDAARSGALHDFTAQSLVQVERG